MITLCTHPCNCADLMTANAALAEQLAAALVERNRLAAQLATAESQAESWQTAYQGMTENYAWYFEAYKDQCQGAAIAPQFQR
jgi:hypothetical protein